MAINFKDIFKSLKEGVSNLAETTFKNFVEQAKEDGEKILNSLKPNLEVWTNELEQGLISVDDFRFLVAGQKELVEMIALKQAGIAMIEADKFKNNVFNLIIDTVTGLI
jgi:hypothetical protein